MIFHAFVLRAFDSTVYFAANLFPLFALKRGVIFH